MRVLERGIQHVSSGKCPVQVNQVSITEAFNLARRRKVCSERRKPSAMLDKALSRNRQNRLRCAVQIFVKTLTGKTVTFDVEGQ